MNYLSDIISFEIDVEIERFAADEVSTLVLSFFMPFEMIHTLNFMQGNLLDRHRLSWIAPPFETVQSNKII